MAMGASAVASRTFVCSDQIDDPAWDAYLERSGGHHTQSSGWADLKAGYGWRPLRVMAVEDDVVGGAQLLVKAWSKVRVGYLARGPAAGDDPELVREIVEELKRVARQERVHFVVAQPPPSPDWLGEHLRGQGFRPSPFYAAPTATVVIDTTLEPDVMLARMKQKTRYNIRLAGRKGVTVRMGEMRDIGTLHRMISATGSRQGFSEYPVEYFERMASVFGLGDRLHIFIAEYEGKPVSALLALCFGDTVAFKKGGWSGSHGNLHTNEAMHWGALKWCHEHGYARYDMEGIDPDVADMVIRGDDLPRDINPLSRFKLGFGGEALRYPGTYDWAGGSLSRGALKIGAGLIERTKLEELAARVRGIDVRK